MNRRLLSFLFILLLFGLFFYVGDVLAQKEEPAVLKNVQVSDDDKSVRILVEASASFSYSILYLGSPPKVVFDFEGLEAGSFHGTKTVVGMDPVIDVSTTQVEKPKKLARIEISLSSPVEVVRSQYGKILFIEIPKTPKTTGKEEIQKPKESSAQQEEPKAEMKTAETTPSPVTKEAEKKSAKISSKPATAVTGVRVDKEDGLKVVILGNGDMKYDVFFLKPNRLVIDIPKTINKVRPLTYAVGDPLLSSIRVGQHKAPIKKVRVVLDLTGAVPYEVVKDGNQLVVNLKGSATPEELKAINEKKDAVKVSPEKDTVVDKETAKTSKVTPDIKKDAAVEPEKAVSPKLTDEGATPVRYTGKKISLDFQDADIITILRLISEVSAMNIIASPEVKGKINVKMLNVPWDQALDVILKNHGLDKVVEDNIIRVAPVNALAKERDDLAKAKEAQAKSEDLMSKIIPLGYSKPGPMKEAIEKAKVLTPRGNVSIDERTNTLIVKDIRKNLAEAEKLINILDKPTPQVSIEARIVEASTTFTRELGIQWGFKNVQSASYGNSLPYNFPHSMTVGGGTLSGASSSDSPSFLTGNNWAVNLPASVSQGSGGALAFSLGNITNSFTLDLQLSALEGTGQGKILSNPKITTLDNEKALIKQGKKIPYLTVSAEGTQTAFIDAVLSLTVTPTITPSGSISMKIEITKNEADWANQVLGVPSIDTKEATTNVLVRDGETIVIGGIMKSAKSESRAGIPWLHKIPILGWLFKKEKDTDETSELLIFITPRIVKQT